jgi:hypothetical protein
MGLGQSQKLAGQVSLHWLNSKTVSKLLKKLRNPPAHLSIDRSQEALPWIIIRLCQNYDKVLQYEQETLFTAPLNIRSNRKHHRWKNSKSSL